MDSPHILNDSSSLFLNNQVPVENVVEQPHPYANENLKQDAINSKVNDLFEQIDPTVGTDSNEHSADKVVSLLEHRFKIRRDTHSLERLKKVLKEDQFKDYYSDYLFDDVVSKLENNYRTFDSGGRDSKKNKRNKRNKSRGR
jgi:hypothetical protein